MMDYIVVLSFAFPWSYGPYAQQLALLIPQLHSEKVLWVHLSQDDAFYAQHDRFEMIGAGFRGKTVVASAVNQRLRRFRIEPSRSVLISLCDVDRFDMDEHFFLPSIAWFPMHHVLLPSAYIRTLCRFSGVAVLSPSGASWLRSQMRDECTNALPYVRHIPHIVLPSAPPATPTIIRTLYPRRFVVGMVFGNYDTLNRKAVDVGFQAFRRFLDHLELEERQECVLVVRGVTINASIGLVHQLDLPFLIRQSRIQPFVHLDTTERSYRDAMHMLSEFDVLLHPSKTEGFGMPALEAQSLGIPVITSKFGAMEDFTFHGAAVPPLEQDEWLPTGYVPTPDVSGFADALRRMYEGKHSTNAGSAQKIIRDRMSLDSVASSFRSFIQSLMQRCDA